MDVHLLGPVEAVADGTPVALGATKQRALLAMLALEAGQTVPADRLVEGLWGEQSPASAQKMVQHYVSQLRRLLPAGTEILTRGRGYELRLGGGTTDVARVSALLDGDGARPREALALWRGPPLADVAGEPFADAEIRRLEELRLRALELAVDEDLAAGRHRQALTDVEALLAAQPLSETLHARRMLALYRSGRQAEALEAYRDARRVLVDEAGIEPGPELRGLHERILRQDPSLDPPRGEGRDDERGEAEEGRDDGRGEAAEGRDGARRRAPRARVLVLAGAALLLATIALIVLTGGDDGLDRIDDDGVGRIDGDGTIEARYAVGRAPGAVVAGGGSIWVASERERTVTRIDRERDRVVTITLGAAPVGLAYAGDSLWVADGTSRRVVRVDPRTDRVVQELEVSNIPRAIAAAGDAVWVATAVDGGITRIDLERGEVGRPLRVGGSPTSLAAGRLLWIAGEADGTVTELDPRSGSALRTIGVGRGPAAVAIGGGAVWVANRDDGTVSRIDPGRGAVTETIRTGRSPVAVAAGDDAVWVANAGDGTLSRIDPRSRRVTRTVEVGGGPTGLVLDGGELWAAAAGDVAGHRGGTLYVASTSDQDVFDADPASPANYTGLNFSFAMLLYDGLVGYRRAGGSAGSQIVPDLAESLPRASDDGRTYAFRLRPGLRYADGAPVRASDFRASLERVLRGQSAAVSTFERILGADGCGPRRCDLSRGVEADDGARTIVIRLRQPDSELLHKLSLPFATLLPRGGAHAKGTPPPGGTGPYRVVAADAPGRGRMVRNPRFRSWSGDARPPAFADEIRFTPGKEGEPDLLLSDAAPQDPSELRRLTTRYGGRLRAEPTLLTQWLFMNTRTPPFDDVRVRRALNFATDRGRLVDLVGGEEAAVITCRYLPPGVSGHRPLCPFTRDAGSASGWTGPDLARARRLVRASGTRGQRVTVWALPDFGGIGPYFRDVLRDLGYRASLRAPSDQEAYFRRFGTDPPQAGVLVWFADNLAPSNFVQPHFTCDAGPLNYSGLCDRRLDALVARALEARDPASADLLWDRVERRLSELAPAVPFLHGRSLAILSERAGNFQHHPLWGPLLDQLWVR
jgi:YVTN family beta-propeller protein